VEYLSWKDTSYRQDGKPLTLLSNKSVRLLSSHLHERQNRSKIKLSNMIENTLTWYKGEIFEGKAILLFGIVSVVLAFLFRFWGSTPYAKALLIPLLAVGLMYAIIGGSMIFSNQKKIATVEQSFEENKSTFIESEKKRVEEFQYLYPLSLVISAICFVLSAIFLGFTKNMYLHATAIALAWVGVAFMAIDYFSKERATIYYEQLTNTLSKTH
jgi:hypothetical protein